MKRKWSLFLTLGFVLFLAACGNEVESSKNDLSSDKVKVVTTIAQIGEPLSVIGGDRVEVESLMGPSVDPHLYNPTQSDVKKVDEADVIFL